MSHIAVKRQQKQQRGSNIRPTHHTRYCFSVHRVAREKQASQQAPRPSTQQRAAEGRKEGGDHAVQHHVQQMVAPGTQAMQGVVKTEGEGAERTEGLVAAAVGEQSPPEVIIEDVGPRSFWKKVLVGFDGSTGKTEEMKSDISSLCSIDRSDTEKRKHVQKNVSINVSQPSDNWLIEWTLMMTNKLQRVIKHTGVVAFVHTACTYVTGSGALSRTGGVSPPRLLPSFIIIESLPVFLYAHKWAPPQGLGGMNAATAAQRRV